MTLSWDSLTFKFLALNPGPLAVTAYRGYASMGRCPGWAWLPVGCPRWCCAAAVVASHSEVVLNTWVYSPWTLSQQGSDIRTGLVQLFAGNIAGKGFVL